VFSLLFFYTLHRDAKFRQHILMNGLPKLYSRDNYFNNALSAS